MNKTYQVPTHPYDRARETCEFVYLTMNNGVLLGSYWDNYPTWYADELYTQAYHEAVADELLKDIADSV